MKKILPIIGVSVLVLLIQFGSQIFDKERQAKALAYSNKYDNFWAYTFQNDTRLNTMTQRIESSYPDCPQNIVDEAVISLTKRMTSITLAPQMREIFVSLSTQHLSWVQIIGMNTFMESMAEHGDAREAAFFRDEDVQAVKEFFKKFKEKAVAQTRMDAKDDTDPTNILLKTIAQKCQCE